MTTVVCDAGPLIHLDELGCIDLLADFSAVLVPEQVWQEVARHRPQVFSPAAPFLQRVTITINASSQVQSVIKTFSLHSGEQAALLLFQERNADLLLTDDSAARLAAQSLGYPVHGTIGIVVRAIRRGQRTRDQALQILRTLPDRSSLHIRSTFLQSIITEIEQAT